MIIKAGGQGFVPSEASKAMCVKASAWRPVGVEARGGVERKVYVGTWETPSPEMISQQVERDEGERESKGSRTNP